MAVASYITTGCVAVIGLLFGVVMILGTIPSFKYAAIPSDDMYWITVNALGGVTAGATYIIVALTAVAILFLSKIGIGRIIGSICSCVSCCGCLVFLALGICILVCGLSETDLQGLDTETKNRIETDFECCIAMENETSYVCAYQESEDPNSIPAANASSTGIADCEDAYLDKVLFRHKIVGSLLIITCFICASLSTIVGQAFVVGRSKKSGYSNMDN